MSFPHLYKFAEAAADECLGQGHGVIAPAEGPHAVGPVTAEDVVGDDAGPGRAPVEIRALREKIRDLGLAQSIRVHAVELNPEISLGHIKIDDDRQGRHDESEVHAHIRFHRELNRCWARFVVCKELMHIFDDPDEVVDNREKFYRLLREIETQPMERSPILASEYKAAWMALLVLCPRDARDLAKAQLERDEVSPYDVALRFRIPEQFIVSLMDDYYDVAFERLIAAPLREFNGEIEDAA